MKPDFAQPRVVIRPTLPSDTPDVLAFCKQIWGGHDYVPLVWEDWLADPQGYMFTATYAGHAVGFTRLARLAPGQWWLEGFRVAPQHQDKKIGSRLHHYAVNWWLEHGEGVIRLWTNAKRVKVHHLCEQTGFVKTQERAFYTASPLLPGEGIGAREVFMPLTSPEIPAATDFALAATSLPLTGGMLDIGWRMATPAESGFQQLLDWPDSRVLWWRDRQGLIGIWENNEHDDLLPMLALAACKTEDLTVLLLDFRRYAAQNDYLRAGWNACLSPELEAVLISAGFARADEQVNYQFERMHPTRSPAG
jgi:GNAT superfamily N-acetyltransferase